MADRLAERAEIAGRSCRAAPAIQAGTTTQPAASPSDSRASATNGGPRDRVRGNSPAGCWSRRLDDPVTQQVPLFEPRHHLRNMVVLADAALYTRGRAQRLDPQGRSSQSVGPPAGRWVPLRGGRTSRRRRSAPSSARRRCRWLGDAGTASAEAGGVQPFNYADKTTLHRSAIDTGAVRFAAEDVGSDSYRGLDLDAARQAREEDMRAAQVAQAMGADIFITARRYVFESSALRQSRVAS